LTIARRIADKAGLFFRTHFPCPCLPMSDDDRFKLLFGPYRTPVFKYGDDAFCELRGDVILCGLTDAPIPGPTGKNRAAGMSRVQYHRPLRERRSQERGTSTSRVRTASMREPCRQATCIAAQLDFPSVTNLDSDRVLRTLSFATGETDEGLDVAQPIVVEGVLVVIRHPARDQFRAVVKLQVRGSIRAASFVPSHGNVSKIGH